MVARPQRRVQLGGIECLERRVGVVVVANHGLERRVYAVVHVRRRYLHVAKRRHAKEELQRRRLYTAERIIATRIQRRSASCTRSELRNAGVGESLGTEQGAVVTRRAARLSEEKKCAMLSVDRERIVVAREVSVERA